jgi:hypothetical protein
MIPQRDLRLGLLKSGSWSHTHTHTHHPPGAASRRRARALGKAGRREGRGEGGGECQRERVCMGLSGAHIACCQATQFGSRSGSGFWACRRDRDRRVCMRKGDALEEPPVVEIPNIARARALSLSRNRTHLE